MKLSNMDKSKTEIWDLANTLYPIYRTLVNKGYERSLNILAQQLPLTIHAYASGTEVWDWTIPNAWDVKEAYVEDSKGRRLIDFSENTLHLSAYSQPFSGWVSREELLSHLRSLEDQPDAIPYNFVYYRQTWEFNIRHSLREKLVDDQYYVKIDVDERPGNLLVGEYYLPGEKKDEIWLSTYLCHPSLANDNLSGVVTAVEIFKELSRQQKRRYSYRLLIVPETIGAIAYLSHHEIELQNVIGGYTVYDCGDSGPLCYKSSYHGNSLIDHAARHILHFYKGIQKFRDYDAGGSDERQYNAPGVRLPFGAITRTPPGEFPQYHTSNDDLSVISAESLAETADTVLRIFGAIESDRTYMNKYKGEPFLSKHGFRYPIHHDHKDDKSRYFVKFLTHEFDGKKSLLQIADKHNIPFYEAKALADQFVKCNLIQPMD